jgi:hypothetical protein
MRKEECFMNSKTIKIIGVLASIGGAAATLASNWASKKEADEKIAEHVTKAVAEALKKESN